MKKKSVLLVIFILLSIFATRAQVTIGSAQPPNTFSLLEIDATNLKGGFRLPQLFSVERSAISVVGNTTTAPGLMIYNKTDNVLEYWNGTTWVRVIETEPFKVSGSGATATQNTDNIYQMGNIGVGVTVPTNKLHVVAATNPLKVEGLVSGVTSDSLVTVDGTGVARRRSVYSLRQDIVKYPSSPTQVFPGMLRYNPTSKQMEYYDGAAWQVMASNAFGGKNEGVVKISGGSGGELPTFEFNTQTAGQYRYINYTRPLTLTAYWPENVISPTDNNIVGTSGVNTTYLENNIVGQLHNWRVIIKYEDKNPGSTIFVTVRLKNLNSSFVLQQTAICPNKTTEGSLTLNFLTIADGASLPSANNGYVIELTADAPIELVVNSITRISSYKD